MNPDKLRAPLSDEAVAALLARAEAKFPALEWREVPERGTWEAEFEGEVLQCPASSLPPRPRPPLSAPIRWATWLMTEAVSYLRAPVNRPCVEEMTPATVCYHCGGYFPLDAESCPACGNDL